MVNFDNITHQYFLILENMFLLMQFKELINFKYIQKFKLKLLFLLWQFQEKLRHDS